ncbi:MAG: hypothetical protein M1826_007006 [Phylliscum demangeonii]|nr:MAG: hypothetical protein M1826_007006 [Phylliscum demangeonii]
MADYYRSDNPYARPRRQYRETIHVETRAAGRPVRQMDLVRRADDDDDGAVEEIEREFPPGQAYGRRAANVQLRRRETRSLERVRDYDDRKADYDGRVVDDERFYAAARYRGDGRRVEDERDEARRSRRAQREEREEREVRKEHRRGRSLSRAQEIGAAAAGAVLAVGGKELYDRRSGSKHRNQSRRRLEQLALGVAGAAAGDLVAKQAVKQYSRVKDRVHEREEDGLERVERVERRAARASGGPDDGYDRGYDAESDYDDRPRRPRHERRKSLGEAALGALGIGAAALSGRDRHGGGDRGYSSSGRRERSASRGRGGSQKLQQAAEAALTAAAVEAWRNRREPGGFFEGEKMRRILTAAAGAGGIDALVDKHPDRHEKRHVGEGAVGGLLLNRLINGSREEAQDDRRSRVSARSYRSDHSDRSDRSDRARPRSRSAVRAIRDVGAAGIAAGVAKQFADRSRSRPGRDRHYSPDGSERSVSPAPGPRSRRRSKSVSEYIDQGMTKLGLRDRKKTGDRAEARRDDGGSRAARSASTSSESSEFSLSEEEKSHRKLKGKEYLTAALATVATVNAANELYESVEKGKKRREALREGKISPEEAKQWKRKGLMKDAAALGLAGLTVKGTVDAWKGMKEQRNEVRCLETKLEKHRRIAERRRSLGVHDASRRPAGVAPAGAATGGEIAPGPGPTYAAANGYGYATTGYPTGPVYQDGNPYASAARQGRA